MVNEDAALLDRPVTHVTPASLSNRRLQRGLDLVKPGGLMVAITSTSTMDNGASLQARELLAEKADLVGAIRLPNTAFRSNAGTEVTTDLLVFRKKDGNAFPDAEPFRNTQPVEAGGGRTVLINEYFARHPEMMLGRMTLAGVMYGPNQPALIPNPGEDLRSALLTAVTRMPARVDGGGVKPPTTVDVGVWNERGSKEG